MARKDRVKEERIDKATVMAEKKRKREERKKEKARLKELNPPQRMRR